MNSLIEITGKVIHGNGKGKTVGMPTANIEFDKTNINISNGVYATEVTLFRENDDGSVVKEIYLGVTNIGTRPSVDNDPNITIETHILDFNEDIYGKSIKLVVIKKIRSVSKFNSLEEVKEQVDKDIVEARKIYKEYKY